MKKVLVCVALLCVLFLGNSCESREDKVRRCVDDCQQKLNNCVKPLATCHEDASKCIQTCSQKYSSATLIGL